MEKDYLKLGIRDFCGQMMEGKFADSDIYIYADNVPNREEFLGEVLVAAMLSDKKNDYYEKVEKHFEQHEPSRKRTKEKEVFSDIVTHPQKEWFIGRLHQLIGDKPGGARVGKILIKAVLDGNLMRFPTQEEFKGEFGLMGTWGAIYNKFHDKDKVMNNAKLYDELDNIVF